MKDNGYQLLRARLSVFCIAIIFYSSSGIASVDELLLYDYEVINTYPHDPGAFTQGLIFNDGYLYESTGYYGHSSLRKIELETGRILKNKKVDNRFFAEGLALIDQKLIQLSWKEGTAFIYDKDSFELIKRFNYQNEGWGLTPYKDLLIMSDGSSVLRLLNQKTFKQTGDIVVSLRGKPVKNINELEMVKGNIYANIWRTDHIAIISPQTGQVTAVADLTGLLKSRSSTKSAGVLNGIAYDPKGDRLFVTGKHWPLLFEIKLVLKRKP